MGIFLFPLKDKVIPENLLVDKRSNIDKFKSILATLQQIYPLETYEDICSTCQRDCAIMDLDPKTNTSVCFQLYKKLIKHYKASNKLSYGETKQINSILQDIGVTTDTTQADQDTIETENQIFNCHDILTTQPQAKCRAKNLPYIKVMINSKLTHFIIDTGASRSICLGQHADDNEQIAQKIDYDPVSISGIMTTSTKCIKYTANFPIQFQDSTSCWNLTAWVASTKVKFKFNLLGSDFLDQYDAIVNMKDKVLLLYNNNGKLEIPFTYIKTFPRQIYQLDSKTDDKNTTDITQTEEKDNININNCIEFQQEALEYFTEKDIQDIKNEISAENQDQPKAMLETLENATGKTNDINLILNDYIEQDSNQTVDLNPVQTNLDKVTILQETDLQTPFMTPDLAHLTPDIADGIRKTIRDHLQAFAKDETDIGEFKLFQVKIDVQEGMTSLQKRRSSKLHQIELYMNNLIKAQVFKETTSSKADKFAANLVLVPKLTSYLQPTKADKHIEKQKKSDNSIQDKTNEQALEPNIQPELRPALDLTGYNRITNGPSRVQLLTPNELLEKVKNSYCSSIDLFHCYFSIKLSKSSRDLINVYWLNGSLLSLQRLPQGWKSSLFFTELALRLTFNPRIIKTFRQKYNIPLHIFPYTHPDKVVSRYVDDVMISSKKDKGEDHHNLCCKFVLYCLEPM